jgi:uncharacterized membrane protein
VIDGFALTLTAAGAVGAAVNGGVFFAFSTFVMRALARLPATNGILAMQAINREAPSPLFMTLLFGTGAISVAAGGVALAELDEPWARNVITGSALYLLCPITTVTYHVPRNMALDRIDPNSEPARDAWPRWHRAWTAGNHIRTLVCVASSVAYVLALRAR